MVCFTVFVSYSETIYSLTLERYTQYHDYTTLYKPISEVIGNMFEYDSLTIFMITVLSIAVETCKWNKIACVYLFANRMFSVYIFNMEITVNAIYVISAINVVISLIIVYKGLKITINR